MIVCHMLKGITSTLDALSTMPSLFSLRLSCLIGGDTGVPKLHTYPLSASQSRKVCAWLEAELCWFNMN